MEWRKKTILIVGVGVLASLFSMRAISGPSSTRNIPGDRITRSNGAVISLPETTETLCGKDQTCTYSNGTHTSPTLNAPQISSPTITGDVTSSGSTFINPLTLTEQGLDPSAPDPGKRVIYSKSDGLYQRDSAGVISRVGGGGGAGSLLWSAPAGQAPLAVEEFGQEAFRFAAGAVQSLVVYMKVSSSYPLGSRVRAFLGFYSPSDANEWRVQLTSTLIRQNLDSITSIVNQNIATSSDITNTVANQFRVIALDVTDVAGQINSVAVSAGDLIKLELTRLAPADGTEDSADVRFFPSSTDIKIGD